MTAMHFATPGCQDQASDPVMLRLNASVPASSQLTHKHDAGSHDGAPLATNSVSNEANREHAKNDSSNL